MIDIVHGDLETTGLNPEFHRPYEAAFITTLVGRPVRHHFWVHAADLLWRDHDPVALDIGRFWDRHPHAAYLQAGHHPVTAPDLHGVWRLDQLLPVIAGLFAGRKLFAGSNPAFDIAMLAPRMIERGITPTWHHHPEDVGSMAKGWLCGRGIVPPASNKTDDLFRVVGVDPDSYPRHTAMGDCELTHAVHAVITGTSAPLSLAELAATGTAGAGTAGR